MSDFEKAKAKVIQYIKAGQLSKENAQQSLVIYKALVAKGQNIAIDVILQKKGWLKGSAQVQSSNQPASSSSQTQKQPAAQSPAAKKSAKKKKKKPLKPTKKVLKIEQDDNKYAAKKRKANKKPAIIGGILLLIILPLAYFLFQKAESDISEHAKKQKRIQEEFQNKTD